MALLSTETELLVLLLALLRWRVAVRTASLAVCGLLCGCIVNGDVEEIVGVIRRTRRIGLALYTDITLTT